MYNVDYLSNNVFELDVVQWTTKNTPSLSIICEMLTYIWWTLKKYIIELWFVKLGCWPTSNVFRKYDINYLSCLIWLQMFMQKMFGVI